jgi:uncharacterized membrane protein YjjP (DUF1212 family)
MKTEAFEPVIARESAEQIANIALEFGRLLMETGASARNVDEITAQVAAGLGAEHVDVRVGYASLAITISLAPYSITRIRKVGPLGVNQRLYHALRVTAAQIEAGGFTVAQARKEMDRLLRATPRHPDWVVAIAVGVACAAFGRLLDVDWAGVGPILVAAALGQIVRRQLAVHKFNVFFSTAMVAFLASTLCGILARLAGSQTVAKDMIGPVLLLVPGIPAFNAQFDILEGRPSLGSARAVWVTLILAFMTLGVWMARGLLGEGR